MKRPRCTCCKIRMKGHKKQRCASQTVIEYEDGSVYTGPTYDGVPSGHGRLESASGRFYKGDFFEGKRHGSGVEFGDDGHSYDGEWRSGVYHGHGHLKMACGKMYDGQFAHGVFHGLGIFVEGKHEYNGQWSRGSRHGKGCEMSEIGQYTGHFRHGFRHGRGHLISVKGDLYIGMWKRGDRCGIGMSTSDEYTYNGEWSRNMRHGHGHCISPLSGEYAGNWHRDMRHGSGINVHTNQTVYDGEGNRGKYNGRGTIKYTDGSRYTGQWLDNDYHGKGELWDGHTTFTGTWKSGNREGLFVDKSSGHTWTGMYCNDVRHGTFVSPSPFDNRLYIWGQNMVFPTVKMARDTVQNFLRSDDVSAAVNVCEFVRRVVSWTFVYKHDVCGVLLRFLPPEEMLSRFKKRAWKLFQQGRFEFLEKMMDTIEITNRQGLLFDCMSNSFVANPWMVRDQSYSDSTKQKLLKGLHLGECGRCPPKDPFTRETLTELSGSYLCDDKKLARSVYKQFIEEMDSKPTVREIAHSFDMDDFEEMLQNAREVNDRDTIRRLLIERNIFIQNVK